MIVRALGLVLGLGVLTASAVDARAQSSPSMYVVHVDAHEELGQGDAAEAARVVLALTERLQTLSMLEFRIFGANEQTRWQIYVSAGQRDNGTLLTRIEPNQEVPTVEQLEGWIASRILAPQSRPGAQVSLWPLQQLVAQFPKATGGAEHQLVRLVSSNQEDDVGKNGPRVTLLSKRVKAFAAAIDLDLAPLRLESEGWKPIARSRVPAELTARSVGALLSRVNAGVERWGSCERVLVGSSLVDVLLLGEGTVKAPADSIRVVGTVTLPERWDLDVGRLKMLRLDSIGGLSSLTTSVATQASLLCRFDSRVQPSWEIVRDGQVFQGNRVFRSERLMVKTKAAAELNADGLAVSVTRGSESGDRLCALTQAMADGCSWQPTTLGTHSLTLVEPNGVPWELLTAQRAIEVVQPPQAVAAVELSPGICAGANSPIPFEDQSFAWTVPETFCVDYRIQISSTEFELTPEQKIMVLSSMRIVVAKGEQVIRTSAIDSQTGTGQVQFAIGEEQGENLLDAGAIIVRAANSRGPSVFRDPVADLAFDVAFAGGPVSSEFQIDDVRGLAYGILTGLILAAAAFVVWLLRRAHFLRVRFSVRGWNGLDAAVVKLRVGPNLEEYTDGLRPVLGLNHVAARRMGGGYELTLQSVRGETKTHSLKRPLRKFEWGPFDLTVTRTRGSDD